MTLPTHCSLSKLISNFSLSFLAVTLGENHKDTNIYKHYILPLYVAGISWTIYAHQVGRVFILLVQFIIELLWQDKYDHVIIGMKSTAHQIRTLDINDRDDCAKKFISNRWVGLGVFLGLLSGTFLKENTEQVPEQIDLQEVVEGVARVVISDGLR